MTPDDLGKPSVSEVVSPGPDARPGLDLRAVVRAELEEVLASKNPKKLTPAAQFAAMADRHIEELKRDKAKLRSENKRLRYREMTHLRDQLTWWQDRATALQNAYSLLKTSYLWAINFNYLSFALITVGGGFVSYAAFLPDLPPVADRAKAIGPWFGSQKFFATLALAALIIGVIIQAYLSYLGSKASLGIRDFSNVDDRPAPNPSLTRGDESASIGD